MISLYGAIILLTSGVLLYVAGEFLVAGLIKLSRHFRITEFVVAFFVMAFAASLPNLFVGIPAALQGIPELSFGDIMGNNVIALTLAVALGIFFAPKHQLPLESNTVRDTTFLTALAALLPLILISDGTISRSDGFILILFFLSYVYFLFSRRERFSQVFDGARTKLSRSRLLSEVTKVMVGIVLLAIAGQGIVYGASLLADGLHIPLLLVGILITGFGGALPEVYFTIAVARRGQTSMIIGNLMGAVIMPATFVLGTVAMIHPIHSAALEFPILARVFLVLIAAFFLWMSQTRSVISIREGAVLVLLYLLFLATLFFVW